MKMSKLISPPPSAQYLRVLSIAHGLLTQDKWISKRDVYYTDVCFFKTQKKTDTILEDLASLLYIPRNHLNIIATPKGCVAGDLTLHLYNGTTIDCMPLNGQVVPPFVDKIHQFRTNSTFVLLVEKECTFMKLISEGFHRKNTCIIITGKGYPDLNTRAFLHKLTVFTKLPVFGLVDFDPDGISILVTYAIGSAATAYGNRNLVTPGIKWLGIHSRDCDRLPSGCLMGMTPRDRAKAASLVRSGVVRERPHWGEEVGRMVEGNRKAEIQALSVIGGNYLGEVYLPEKIRSGQWL